MSDSEVQNGPLPKVRLLGRDPDGTVYTSHQALSLLFGVDVTEVSSVMETVNFERDGVQCLPAAWRQAGMRRAREAMAHTGSRAFAATLAYWADKEYGRTVVFESDTEIWLI